jgi:hypothetical protein
MTALENLIDSDMDDPGALIQKPKESKTTKRLLKNIIEKCLAK